MCGGGGWGCRGQRAEMLVFRVCWVSVARVPALEGYLGFRVVVLVIYGANSHIQSHPESSTLSPQTCGCGQPC